MDGKGPHDRPTIRPRETHHALASWFQGPAGGRTVVISAERAATCCSGSRM